MAPLAAVLPRDGRVLVGPETSDDAGVFLLDGTALLATADFITPVCDDPRLFGRVAAANALSDVYAMGGEPLFALNLCCFPPAAQAPPEVLREILVGAAEALREAGAALLGGHSVTDDELKFGLAVVGRADPDRLLTNAGARPGDRLVLSKPIGTGVLINAHKLGRLGAAALAPALAEMARLNAAAARLALAHGARAATDVTGFGLAGHALEMARASRAMLRLEIARVPRHEPFDALVRKGITTGSTAANLANVLPSLSDRVGLGREQTELLADPQTSGGLLIALPAEAAGRLLAALLAAGHGAAEVGEVAAGPAGLVIV